MKLTNSEKALIIINSGLSLKKASAIFKVDEDELLSMLKTANNWLELSSGFEFLFNYDTINEDAIRDNKANSKACLYFSKLELIDKISDITLRKQKRDEFILELRKANLDKILENHDGVYWTDEEKKYILEYKLLYALSSYQLSKRTGINPSTIERWINEYEEGFFKNRLKRLNEFELDRFKYIKSLYRL